MATDNTQKKKIDPAEAGISMAGLDGPSAYIDGKEKYRRIFIRLRTPYETLTCIIENWFNSIVRKGNYLLTFEAMQITDEEAESMLQQSNP